MRLLKNTIIFALAFTTVLMFSGCSNTAQSQVSGKSLFKIENCESIELQIGSLEYKTKEQKDMDNISTLISSLRLKKVNIDDLEGGIFVIVNIPNEEIDIRVCGKNILYNDQWYVATEDISDQLQQYFD